MHSILIETGPIVEEAMNDKAVGGLHWSFWIISVATLLFNVMGVINYFVQMNTDSLASFPESYRPISEGRPAWATAAFAIAVFGGSLGCLLLLLRKSAAFYVLIASLLGVIVSMMHIFNVAGFRFNKTTTPKKVENQHFGKSSSE